MPDLRRLLPFPIEERGRYPVEARHHPPTAIAYTTGKNASHITLVIDAMDLLHSGQFDGLCLVSSDRDFTRLAARIREQGVDVFGFGEHKTPESFRQACRTFVYTENLLAGARQPGSCLAFEAASARRRCDPRHRQGSHSDGK